MRLVNTTVCRTHASELNTYPTAIIMSRPALTGVPFFLLLLLFLSSSELLAQGGYAGSFLRRADSPAEAAMGGTLNPWSANAAILFRSGAALTHLEHPSVFLSGSILPDPQRGLQAGIATNLGKTGGLGFGITSYSVTNIDLRGIDERPLGTTSSRDMAITLAGGIKIGPGSVGGSLRYLRYDIAELDGASWGLTMDISGTLTFREHLVFTVELGNIAGEMNASYQTSLREAIPYEARLGVTYAWPLKEETTPERLGPSGKVEMRKLRPRTYILGTGGIRISEFDEELIVEGAIEAVPVELAKDAGLGFRTGLNSRGDVAFGFFLDAPIDLGEHPRLSFASRRDYERAEFSIHGGLEFHF